MKHIVLFGAGKSATCLIDYLLNEMLTNNWKFTVCDSNLSLAKTKIRDTKNAIAVSILVENEEERNPLIKSADLVISLLPPELHFIIAKACVIFKKTLLTASYIDNNIKSLTKEINDNGLLFLCEMGLDPGIDHMSAMKIIESIKSNDGNISSFISHCGGLVAPESDDNPWHYKITWNPRNIVLAGKDGSVYRKENTIVKVPYNKIFANATSVNIDGLQALSWYPNRDSLSYIPLYSLDGIPTFIRTTLRYPPFCRAWNKLVTIGCTSTNDFEQIKHCKTFEDWFKAKIGPFVLDDKDWGNYLQLYVTDPYSQEFRKQITFLGFYNEDALPGQFTCSADILQNILEKRLAMKEQDKDMIVMLHEIEYQTVSAAASKKQKIQSSLIVKGEDSVRTAMAKTVGLPLGIAAKLILQEKIQLKGLHIPIVPEIYEPVLKELEEHGIAFSESNQPIQ